MIRVTGLNHKEFLVNADQIEIIEEIPECVLILMNGNKYIVQESSDEIINKIIEYKNRVLQVRVVEGEK